jgi:hypothetical protein
MPAHFTAGAHHIALSYLFNPALGPAEDQTQRQKFRGLILAHDRQDYLEGAAFATRCLTGPGEAGDLIEVRAVFRVLAGHQSAKPDVAILVRVRDGIIEAPLSEPVEAAPLL